MKYRRLLLPLISFVVIIILWELLVKVGILDSLFIPPPSKILKSSTNNVSYYFTSILITLKHILIGYIVGIILAIPLGIFLGWNKKIELSLYPLFLIISTIPIVTFLPLFILWFGLNEIPIYLCAIIASFFPSFLNTVHGVKKIGNSYIEVAKNFKIKSIMRKVVLPASTPYISNGLRQSIQITFLVTPVAEMIMGDVGLGGFIWKNADLFRTELVILGMITLGILGILLFNLYGLIEHKYLLKWMEERKNVGSKKNIKNF